MNKQTVEVHSKFILYCTKDQYLVIQGEKEREGKTKGEEKSERYMRERERETPDKETLEEQVFKPGIGSNCIQ